jgi:hypothetical protein
MMKKILILLLVPVLFSCNKSEEKSEPILACPLSMEFDRLEVKFLFNGALPVTPVLYIENQEITACDDDNSEFCIYGIENSPSKMIYKMQARIKVQTDITIEILDGTLPRITRTNEPLERARTRPNDECGSGFIAKITLQE